MKPDRLRFSFRHHSKLDVSSVIFEKQKRHSLNTSKFAAWRRLRIEIMYFAFGRNSTIDERRINESSKNQSRLEGIFVHPYELPHFLFIVRDSFLICGIVLNILVLYVMLRSRKIRKNLSSFLIFHLSLSHVLLYFLLPIFKSSPIFSCANKEFARHLFGAAIFGTLATIAVDRYRNIAQPFKSLTPRRLKTFFL